MQMNKSQSAMSKIVGARVVVVGESVEGVGLSCRIVCRNVSRGRRRISRELLRRRDRRLDRHAHAVATASRQMVAKT